MAFSLKSSSPSSRPLPIISRYILIGIHVVLLVLATILSGVYTASMIMLVIHGSMALAMLIYVPGAVWVSVRDSSGKFDHAGGEVAYVVVQLAGWIPSTILAFIFRYYTDQCQDSLPVSSVIYTHKALICPMTLTVGILSLFQVILTTIWLIWLIILAHHAVGRTPSQAFQIPTHRLVAMSYGAGGASDGDLDLYEARQLRTDSHGDGNDGLVGPFLQGRAPAYQANPATTADTEPVPGYDDPYYTPYDRSSEEAYKLLALATTTGGRGTGRGRAIGSSSSRTDSAGRGTTDTSGAHGKM